MAIRIEIYILTLLFLCSAAAYSQPESMLLPVRVEEKWGFIDQEGKMMIPPKFDWAGDFNGFGAPVKIGMQYGIVSRNGQVLITGNYQQVNILTDFLASVSDGDHWGLVNKEGEIVAEVEYERIIVPAPTLLALQKNEKYMFVNDAGKVLTKGLVDEYSIIAEKYILLENDGKYGLIDVIGKEIVPHGAEEVKFIDREGYRMFAFLKNGLYGLVDNNGKVLLRPEWDEIQKYDSICVKLLGEKGWGSYHLPTGKFIYPPEYQQISPFTENTVLLYKYSLRGLGTIDGDILIPPVHDDIRVSGHPSLVKYLRDRSWGLMTGNGTVILPPTYLNIQSFKDNLAMVDNGMLYGVINHRGKEIVPVQFEKLDVQGSVVKAYRDSSIVLFQVDENGDLIDEAEFENVKTIKVVKTERNITGGITFSRTGAGAEFLGWFYDTEKGRWGLKDSLDSIRIRAVFSDVRIFADLQMALVSVWEKDNIILYGLFDHAQDKFIAAPIYIDINMSDLERGAFARAVNRNGLQSLIFRDGKIMGDIIFTGNYENGLMRINYGGKLRFTDNDQVLPVMSKEELCLMNRVVCRYFIRNQYAYVNIKSGKWGFIDSTGHITWVPEAEYIRDFVGNTALFYREGQWGVMNEHYEIALPPVYDKIRYLTTRPEITLNLMKTQKKMGYVDRNGSLITAFEYDDGLQFSEGYTAVRKNGRWHMIGKKGDIFSGGDYKKLDVMYDGLMPFKEKYTWGFIDVTGEEVVAPRFRRYNACSEGLCPVVENVEYGYINSSGEWVIEPKYRMAKPFQHGMAMVNSGYHWGLIDHEGKYILRPKYIKIELFPDEQLIIGLKRTGKYMLYDWNGKPVVRKKFFILKPPSEDLIAYTRRGSGFIDLKGNKVIDNTFKGTGSFKDGLARVYGNRAWGYIDRKGNWVIEPQYSECTDFSDGRAAFKADNRLWGIIDINGDTIAPSEYAKIYSYSDGLCLAKNIYGRYVFLDKEGSKLFGRTFDMAYSFENGVAIVKDGQWGIIDRSGNYLLEPNYAEIRPFADGLAPVFAEALSGVADATGNVLVEVKYESVSYAGNNIFKVWSGNKVQYVTGDGRWIWR